METSKKYPNDNPQGAVIRVKSKNTNTIKTKHQQVNNEDVSVYEPLYVPLKIRDYSKK